MSPASSGALEIERYIGACLISSQQGRHKGKHHHLQQHQQPPPPHSQSQHHHHHNHNQIIASNHNYVPDLYRGYQHHHHQHPQASPQHVVAAAAHQQQQVCGGDRWAGGLPLIVYAKHQQHQHQQRQYLVAGNWPRHMVDVPTSDKRIHQSVQQQQRQQQSQECINPLSRLAVHTQGAPLILSNNRYRNKSKVKFNASCGVNGGVNKQFTSNSLISGSPVKSNKCRENNVDTVSVASDESSGSANSENCLPRIIKPRKRRKKDRKPPPHLSTSSTLRSLNQDDSFSTDSGTTASPDIISITTPMALSFPLHNTSGSVTSTGSNDISETPNLHHSFEDVEDHLDVTDINGNVESSCQCRYCDPSGQIWDIDRNCYSPFLTSPEESMFRFPISSSPFKMSTLSSIDQSLPSHIEAHLDHQHLHHQCLVNDISAFSLEDSNRAIGHLDKVSSNTDSSQTNQKHRSQPDLEVSTEIVTSLNGHRDLEIKFFTPPTSLRKDCTDVVCDNGEGEIDNHTGYLLLDVNCENVLTSQVCD